MRSAEQITLPTATNTEYMVRRMKRYGTPLASCRNSHDANIKDTRRLEARRLRDELFENDGLQKAKTGTTKPQMRI